MASLISDLHSSDPEILVRKNNRFVTTLTLNRPRKLNALSVSMLSRLSELFLRCDNDPHVKLVILKATGKAFSPGGDIASVAQHLYNGNVRAACRSFATAYGLMYLVATKTRPQVSFLNGMTMGTGAGVSIHGSFSVVTEKTVFAMPEAAIGGFPDVGSTYFLSRLPGFFGEYLGLTAILDTYSEQPALKAKSASHRMDVINKCFSQSTVEEILSSLEKEYATSTNTSDHHEWLSSSIQSMKNASPISLKIALKSIRGGRKLQGVGECIVLEYRIICHVLRGEISKDFMEGCRAILLDKDKNPKWEPSRLELVTDQMVSHYFSRLDDDEELKLPQTSKLSVTPISKL
ncbi:hypothetical protein ACLB2K_074264 [Fragaria x ananassa]